MASVLDDRGWAFAEIEPDRYWIPACAGMTAFAGVWPVPGLLSVSAAYCFYPVSGISPFTIEKIDGDAASQARHSGAGRNPVAAVLDGRGWAFAEIEPDRYWIPACAGM
ncbi:hypothetical protein, partial [Dyella japonica]|uniref:hypothetical protein n=1 Tax=Dyella japonica TaxID=231455 RepID=UPI001E459224